jgi:hypothetical protein
MLGEAATTASPVQYMKFDEQNFDRQRRRPHRRWRWLVVVTTCLAAAIALAL